MWMRRWMLLLILLLQAQLTTQLSATAPSPPKRRDHSSKEQRHRWRIGVIGGGASGMFAATAAADALGGSEVAGWDVVVLEGGRRTMTKVTISGGGRCNVLHDTSKPLPDILNGYPRGKKELTGLMTKRFSPSQAEEWFTKRGVQLKTEADGRMFPTTDSSQTIIDTITRAAEKAGVVVRRNKKVSAVERVGDRFVLTCGPTKGRDGDSEDLFDALILATGSSPLGYEFATNLGHTMVKPVPSLFTLNAKHQVKEGGIFHGLSGLSVQNAKVTFKVAVPGRKKKAAISQGGPLLITHHGLSGPAALRLSAFAAREFHEANYRGDVFVHWAPEMGNTDEIEAALWKATSSQPKRRISASCPLLREDGSSPIPRRLWSAFVLASGFDKDTVWGEAPKKKVRALTAMVCKCIVDVTGKGVFKEEFVTAGGVSLKEINMKNMGSKKCAGLFCCGEVIDVDGVTGGFNFMNCWSTGYVAGNGAADVIQAKHREQLKEDQHDIQ